MWERPGSALKPACPKPVERSLEGPGQHTQSCRVPHRPRCAPEVGGRPPADPGTPSGLKGRQSGFCREKYIPIPVEGPAQTEGHKRENINLCRTASEPSAETV